MSEQAQQMLYQMQMLEQYAADLAQREAALAGVLREAAAASESIKSIIKSEASSLVPLGLGAFVRTTIPHGDKLIINIGAGVAVEKDREAALNYVELRIKEIETALQETSARRQEAAASLEQGRHQLGQLAAAPPGKE